MIAKETINIKNGKMVVKVSGFTEVKGKDFGLLSVIAQGEEIRAESAKDDRKGNCTYTFKCSAMPDAMWFYPADGGARVLLWKDSDYVMKDPWISPEYAGVWEGTAVPAGDRAELQLTCELHTDGTGIYSYKSEDGAAKLPFTVVLDGREFHAVVAEGVMPVTALEGTWKLQRAVLKLDVKAILSDGEEVSYTVSLRKSAETEDGE